MLRRVNTGGIAQLEPLEGSAEWYWGTDYACGDLYEAEEAFRQRQPYSSNRLILVHFPDGAVLEPVKAAAGQYFGRPIFFERGIVMLRADFPAGRLSILRYEPETRRLAVVAELGLDQVEDCYNLMLRRAPLMLTRSGGDNMFQIIWPDRREFPLTDTEAFLYREGDRLYFAAWYEDPDYREETLVRDYSTGRVIERLAGSVLQLPDGQRWLLG